MRLLFSGALSAFLLLPVVAQQQQPPKPKEPTEAEIEERDSGIPVTSDAVRKACSACHKVDEKGRMTRISWRRTTPEGWEQTIKRMISLNGLRLEPADAREILRYLADHHGLAPEEAKPAAFEVEKRMDDYKYTANKDTEDTCTKCHSMGRVLSQRRSKSEWELLIAMHRGYYPLSDFQAFRRVGPRRSENAPPPPPGTPPPDDRHPMDKVIPHLTSAFPLKTPEWSSWAANMRAPKLAGRWAFSGYQVGKGPIYGETIITATAKDDEFTTEARYTRAKTGDVVTRQGKAIVYTGFQWRGRSNAGDNDVLREVMSLDRNQRELSGRWFTGAYEETGIDVTLTRLGNDPVVLGLDRKALQKGGVRQVKIYGANFPANLSPAVIDFGPGVTVQRVVSATPNLATVEVKVGADAIIGPRDVLIAGVARQSAAVVYDKIDSIKVRPQAGMARVGGVDFPKQMQQFEAIAYSNGADGKMDTKDDLDLGPIEVAWSIEEYTATFDDDDKSFVGKLDDNGLFTPNVDGPNPKRQGNGNNSGDVWVMAALKMPDGKVLRARAFLLVTLPLYIRFDQPEVAQ